MNHFFRLFKCQLKRFFSYSAGIFIFSAVFFLSLAFIASVFVKNMSFSGTRKRIPIGIVGDVSIPYFEAGLTTLKYLDSSNQFVEIISLPLEEAQDRMKKGKLSAYIIIPEDFIESVECGANDKQVTYITAAGAQGIESIFKEHVADIVASLLINAQAGIFAMENLTVEYGQRSSLYDYNYEMNMDYIKWALDRKDFIRIEEVPVSNGVSLYGYYLCAVICSFLIFFSIGSLWFFTGDNKDRYKFHSAGGFSSIEQITSEFLAYFFLVLACLIIIFIFITVFVMLGQLPLSEWRFGNEVPGLVKLFIISIIVCLMFCALHLMLFELIPQTVPAVLLQFLTGFCLSFIGGVFYPLDFFPVVIQKIGHVLPVGQAIFLMDSSLAGKLNILSLFICLMYTVLFFSVAILFRSQKIKEESDK